MSSTSGAQTVTARQSGLKRPGRLSLVRVRRNSAANSPIRAQSATASSWLSTVKPSTNENSAGSHISIARPAARPRAVPPTSPSGRTRRATRKPDIM